jgi:hypothetical protein
MKSKIKAMEITLHRRCKIKNVYFELAMFGMKRSEGNWMFLEVSNRK